MRRRILAILVAFVCLVSPASIQAQETPPIPEPPRSTLMDPYCDPGIVQECILAIETWKTALDIEQAGRYRAEKLLDAAILTATTAVASQAHAERADTSGFSLETVLIVSGIFMAVGFGTGLAVAL